MGKQRESCDALLELWSFVFLLENQYLVDMVINNYSVISVS